MGDRLIRLRLRFATWLLPDDYRAFEVGPFSIPRDGVSDNPIGDLIIGGDWLAQGGGCASEILWNGARRLRDSHALLRRAHDAMSRREPDGISEADWDQLVTEIAAEVGVANA